MSRFAAEKGQQVDGQIRSGDGRSLPGPQAVLGQTAQNLEGKAPVRGMESEAAAHEGVVQAQFPVLPGTEEKAAAQLLEEGTRRRLQPVAVPGGVEAREAGALELGGIAGERLRIILRLQARGETAQRIVQLEIVIGTPGMFRGADDAVVQIIDGVRLHAAGDGSPVLRPQGSREASRTQQDQEGRFDYLPAHFFTWESSSCSSPGR